MKPVLRLPTMTSPRRPTALLAGLLLLAFIVFASPAPSAPWQQEEAMDRQLGLLDHPWKVNLVRPNLRSLQPSQVRLCLPPYAQQPEGFSPASPSTGGTTGSGSSGPKIKFKGPNFP